MARLPALALIGTLLWAHCAAFGAEVRTQISSTTVALGDTLDLVLEVDGEPTAPPDLSVLASDFEILNRRTQRNISVVNGRRSARHVLVLTLLPRRTGELEIPPVSYGGGLTAPQRLLVTEHGRATAPAPAAGILQDTAHNAAPEVMLETSAEPTQARVGQQVLLTARVFMDAPVIRPRLRDPNIPSARVLPLGEDRYDSRRDGRSYSVYERRYAIFPREPGEIQIGRLLFEGWTQATGGSAESAGYPPRERSVRALSEPLTIEALPTPQGVDSQRWLPARNLSLTESGPETIRVVAGHPVERRITLRAEGLMAAELPPVPVEAPYQLSKVQGRPQVWDERRPDGVVGSRRESVTLTAPEPGHYRLPPLSLDWWNTGEGHWETAMLPARDLIASAGQIAESAIPPTAPTASSVDLPSAVTSGAAEQRPGPSETLATEPQSGSAGSRHWIWLTAALGLAWIATMGAWWRSRRRSTRVAPSPAREPVFKLDLEDPLEDAIASVRAAYEAGNAAAAREALLAWAAQVLPENTPSNLARLAQRCTEPLRGNILMVEEAFFSPQPVPWNEQPVWDRLRHFVPAPDQEPASFRRPRPLRRRAPNPDSS